MKDFGAAPSGNFEFGRLVDILRSNVGLEKKCGRSKSGDSGDSLVVDTYVCLEV